MEAISLTKVVVCPHCGYMGDDLSKVVEHLQAVRPLPTVKCPRCGSEVESTSFALHMTRHVRVSGKSRVCDICGEKFPDEGRFLRHVREHLVVGVKRHGMVVWYCLVCGLESTDKYGILVHVLKRHELE